MEVLINDYDVRNMITELRNLQTNIHENEYEIFAILEALYDWEMRLAKLIGYKN